MDKKQIPFRYNEDDNKRLSEICKIQRWTEKKNQAIKHSLEITEIVLKSFWPNGHYPNNWDIIDAVAAKLKQLKK